MKRVFLFLVAATTSIFGECNETNCTVSAAQCFSEIAQSLGAAAKSPTDKTVVEDAVCNMVVATITMLENATKNGISLSAKECQDIINSLKADEKEALLKILAETTSVTSQEDEGASIERGCCSSSCDSCKCKCKDKCGCCKGLGTTESSECEGGTCPVTQH